MFTRLTVLDFAGKNFALSFIAHELADGQAPLRKPKNKKRGGLGTRLRLLGMRLGKSLNSCVLIQTARRSDDC